MAGNKLEKRAKDMLGEMGLNITKPQIRVLQELLCADSPISRQDLLKRLGESGPDKVTVYRILEKLSKIGLVHKAYVQKRAWNYELAHHCGEKQCHPHFTCNNCGKTFCMTDSAVPLVRGLKKGFVIQRQQVRIEGLCPVCS